MFQAFDSALLGNFFFNCEQKVNSIILYSDLQMSVSQYERFELYLVFLAIKYLDEILMFNKDVSSECIIIFFKFSVSWD